MIIYCSESIYITTQLQEDEGILSGVLIRDLGEAIQLLSHQDQILMGPDMVQSIGVTRGTYHLGSNLSSLKKTLTTLFLGGNLMTLIFMRTMHVG